MIDHLSAARRYRPLAALVLVLGAVGTAAAQSAPAVEVQYPFVCTTARNGLGQPKVDNQAHQGIPVAEEGAGGDYPHDEHGYPAAGARIVGWSRDCAVDPQFRYYYRAPSGRWRWVARPRDVPRDSLVTTTTTDGKSVPLVARVERGTLDRFIYSVAMLAPLDEADPRAPDRSLWNRRLLFSLQGGVAIGHTQGVWSESAALLEVGLRQGYAVVNSTGLRTNTHYDLIRGGRTALALKKHFIETHGEPLYTIAVGGSGGAIEQYIYQQNLPGLFDGGVPEYSYPDMVTQTIHIGDCELLEHYFESTDVANPRWRDIRERSKVLGLNAEVRPVLSEGDRKRFNGLYEQYRALGIPTPDGWNDRDTIPMTECRPGWYGLMPLAMNPTFTDVEDIDQLAEGTAKVQWTHWADAEEVYGVDERGWARQTWDNEGVQYGLGAVASGAITPAEFLRLNALVGGWKHASEMVPEGCPFVESKCGSREEFDPWSARQMKLSPDGRAPAPRTRGDTIAMRNAWERGHVFRGKVNIPLIDLRPYLEHQLNMHNTVQSFASRERIDRAMGNHDAQIIWFVDARPDQLKVDRTAEAFEVLHDWITNLRAHPERGVAGNRPAAAVDGCWSTDGALIAQGDSVWNGVLDSRPAGACTRAFPIHSTSRIQAGGPITGEVFRCRLMPVHDAVARGLYGRWKPTPADVRRLEEIFPTGVCDYTRPGVGQPPAAAPPGR